MNLDCIRVYLTDSCNMNCSNCFNKNYPSTQRMSVGDFSNLCKYLSGNGIKFLRILGGEPTTHPNFVEMYNIAQQYFESVNLFTNGTQKDVLNQIEPRERDAIVYNFHFSEYFDERTLLLDKKGLRTLEVQVHPDVPLKNIYAELDRVCRLYPRMRLNFTLDCMDDPFKNRENILYNLFDIIDWADYNNLYWKYDHRVPLCFIKDENLPEEWGSECEAEDSGLIDSQFNLRFCNQDMKPLLNVKKDDGFIEWKEVEDVLQKRFEELQKINKSKKCGRCPDYNHGCNGGCWMFKDFVNATN